VKNFFKERLALKTFSCDRPNRMYTYLVLNAGGCIAKCPATLRGAAAFLYSPANPRSTVGKFRERICVATESARDPERIALKDCAAEASSMVGMVGICVG
jgi:hypothetical protein